MTASLQFPFSTPPTRRELIEVAPGILWTRFALPYLLNHVNAYLIDDGDGWVAVDAGYDSRATREDWEALLGQAIQGRPITRLLVTHFHPDHIGTAGWLSRRLKIPVIMSRGEFEMAQRMFNTPQQEAVHTYAQLYRANGMDEDYVGHVLASGHNYRDGVQMLPDAYQRVKAGDTFVAGKRSFKFLTGGGHSPEQVMLLDADAGLLICADQVLARISPNISVMAADPGADPLGKYLCSLRQLVEAVPHDALVLPGHDRPFYGLHLRIAELREHHEKRCEIIEAACHGRPMNVSELVPFVFERELGHTQFPFALTETLAHVNLMLREHRLASEAGRKGLVYRTP